MPVGTMVTQGGKRRTCWAWPREWCVVQRGGRGSRPHHPPSVLWRRWSRVGARWRPPWRHPPPSNPVCTRNSRPRTPPALSPRPLQNAWLILNTTEVICAPVAFKSKSFNECSTHHRYSIREFLLRVFNIYILYKPFKSFMLISNRSNSFFLTLCEYRFTFYSKIFLCLALIFLATNALSLMAILCILSKVDCLQLERSHNDLADSIHHTNLQVNVNFLVNSSQPSFIFFLNKWGTCDYIQLPVLSIMLIYFFHFSHNASPHSPLFSWCCTLLPMVFRRAPVIGHLEG